MVLFSVNTPHGGCGPSSISFLMSRCYPYDKQLWFFFFANCFHGSIWVLVLFKLSHSQWCPSSRTQLVPLGSSSRKAVSVVAASKEFTSFIVNPSFCYILKSKWNWKSKPVTKGVFSVQKELITKGLLNREEIQILWGSGIFFLIFFFLFVRMKQINI